MTSRNLKMLKMLSWQKLKIIVDRVTRTKAGGHNLVLECLSSQDGAPNSFPKRSPQLGQLTAYTIEDRESLVSVHLLPTFQHLCVWPGGVARADRLGKAKTSLSLLDEAFQMWTVVGGTLHP